MCCVVGLAQAVRIYFMSQVFKAAAESVPSLSIVPPSLENKWAEAKKSSLSFYPPVARVRGRAVFGGTIKYFLPGRIHQRPGAGWCRLSRSRCRPRTPCPRCGPGCRAGCAGSARAARGPGSARSLPASTEKYLQLKKYLQRE